MELSKGGAGKKGGLREYARRVGRAHNTIIEWSQAAEVVTGRMSDQFFDRTTTSPRSTPRRKSSFLSGAAFAKNGQDLSSAVPLFDFLGVQV